jgi:protein-L-isoaspartate O-methyltransferase
MTARSKVLLLNPGALGAGDQDFGLPHLVALGSYLDARLGVQAEIIDLGYEGADLRRALALVEELGPLVAAGVSCYSSFDHLRVRAIGRALRQRFPELPLIVGGYHASALPAALVDEGLFDCAVVGEGERPLQTILEVLLGGGRPAPVVGPEVVEDLDELPPYDWSLLRRYLPRAEQLGRKAQIYLSRGCPFHCTFCMERCKAASRWRPFSPERALDELRRLGSVLELRNWVLNIADPLFGLQSDWRRQVLEGIARQGLLPRQHWTLTRVDALEEEDVRLLARARFAIGVGLESGSPAMLALMRKTEKPERYLDGIRRFAALARRSRLSWAANIILGHPGETGETMAETAAYARELFAGPTPGWLSVDPFRLYPGSEVFVELDGYRARGARFPFDHWWEMHGDMSAAAELVDPSAELVAEERVRLMHELFGGLVAQIRTSFQYTGRTIDAVYEGSLEEQVALLSGAGRRRTLTRMAALRQHVTSATTAALLEEGIAAPADLCAAMEQIELRGVQPHEHGPPRAFYARALVALAPAVGETALVIGPHGGYGAAVTWLLVGPEGSVCVTTVESEAVARARRELAQGGCEDVRVARRDATRSGRRRSQDVILVEGCAPRLPGRLAGCLRDGGRLVVALGPMFRTQQLTLVVRRGDQLESYDLGAVSVPPLVGSQGWRVRAL